MEIAVIEYIVAQFIAIIHIAAFLKNGRLKFVQTLAIMALPWPRRCLLNKSFDGFVEHFRHTFGLTAQ